MCVLSTPLKCVMLCLLYMYCTEALFGQAPYASQTMEQLLEKIANEHTITVSSFELGTGKGVEFELGIRWG